jgi:hypothetical protein
VGSGKIGAMTKSLQAEFYGIVRGEKPDRYNWLTPVRWERKVPVSVEAALQQASVIWAATAPEL